MTRLLFLLTMTLWAYKPVLLLVTPHTQGLTLIESKQLEQALALAFSQSDYFNVLSLDEREQAYQSLGYPTSPQCQTKGCLWDMGQVLRADLVLGSFVRKVGDSLLLDTQLYGMKEQAVLRKSKRIGLFRGTQGLLQNTRDVVQDLVGFVQDSPSYSQKASDATQSYPVWGAITLTSGVALYTTWKWLEFNKKDDKTSSADSLLKQDIPLSGLRGFFASTAPDAKYRAMGGAAVASVRGARAALWNPAGLTKLTQKEWQLGRTELLDDLYKDFTIFASPAGKNLFQAHGVTIEGDELAKEVRYFSSWATDLSQWSMYLRSVALGASLSMYQVSVGNTCYGEDCVQGTALGGGLDLGLQWRLQKEFLLGVFLQDVYSELFYNNAYTNESYTEDLPPLLTLGVAWEGSSTTLSADWQKGLYADQQDHFRLGLEKVLWSVFAVRGGLQQLPEFRVWSTGFGFSHRRGLYGLGLHYDYEYSEKSFWQHNQSFLAEVSF